MTTPITTTTTTSNRVAAGVTAAYVRELSRRSAPAPLVSDGRRAATGRHRAAAPRFVRDRAECGRRRAALTGSGR